MAQRTEFSLFAVPFTYSLQTRRCWIFESGTKNAATHTHTLTLTLRPCAHKIETKLVFKSNKNINTSTCMTFRSTTQTICAFMPCTPFSVALPSRVYGIRYSVNVHLFAFIYERSPHSLCVYLECAVNYFSLIFLRFCPIFYSFLFISCEFAFLLPFRAKNNNNKANNNKSNINSGTWKHKKICTKIKIWTEWNFAGGNNNYRRRRKGIWVSANLCSLLPACCRRRYIKTDKLRSYFLRLLAACRSCRPHFIFGGRYLRRGEHTIEWYWFFIRLLKRIHLIFNHTIARSLARSLTA